MLIFRGVYRSINWWIFTPPHHAGNRRSRIIMINITSVLPGPVPKVLKDHHGWSSCKGSWLNLLPWNTPWSTNRTSHAHMLVSEICSQLHLWTTKGTTAVNNSSEHSLPETNSKRRGTKRKFHLPTSDFRGWAVFFREGNSSTTSPCSIYLNYIIEYFPLNLSPYHDFQHLSIDHLEYLLN